MSGRLPLSLKTLSKDEKEYDGLKRTVREQNKEINELRLNCRQKNDEIGDLRLERYHLQELVTSLRADRNRLQERILRQHQQLRMLEENFGDFKRSHDDIVGELTKCQDAMMKSGHEMLEMAEEIGDKNARIRNLEQSLTDVHGN